MNFKSNQSASTVLRSEVTRPEVNIELGIDAAMIGPASVVIVAPDILTDRLRINDLTPVDAPALFNYRSDAKVASFQSWLPESIADALAFIVRTASRPFNENDSWYQLAVRSAATDELLGDLGVHFVADDGHQVEIGFTIAPMHQRQGLGTLAVLALLDYVFMVLHKHRVFASVDPRNVASIALLRKVGMRQEAHFRQSLFWKGEWVDDVVFGLLRSEWIGSGGRPRLESTIAARAVRRNRRAPR